MVINRYRAWGYVVRPDGPGARIGKQDGRGAVGRAVAGLVWGLTACELDLDYPFLALCSRAIIAIDDSSVKFASRVLYSEKKKKISVKACMSIEFKTFRSSSVL